MQVINGWYVENGRVIWGFAQHNGWWAGYREGTGWYTQYRVRPNITRYDPLNTGPCFTESFGKSYRSNAPVWISRL